MGSSNNGNKMLKDLSIHFDSFASSQSLTSLILSLEGSVAKEEDFAQQGGGEAPADGTLEILVSWNNEQLSKAVFG